VANYIEQNNIPIPFLIMLFAHFMSMVIDRYGYVILCANRKKLVHSVEPST